jgi:hypothetical protein
LLPTYIALNFKRNYIAQCYCVISNKKSYTVGKILNPVDSLSEKQTTKPKKSVLKKYLYNLFHYILFEAKVQVQFGCNNVKYFNAREQNKNIPNFN